MASTANLSMKLLVDTKKNRVLYAEAGKDVVDFLFSLLALPVGTVVRLLMKQGMVGTLGNMYQSVEDLDETYIQPKFNKDTLLMPKVSIFATNSPLLLSNAKPSTSTTYFRCGSSSLKSNHKRRRGNNNCPLHVSADPTAVCPQCRCIMTTEVPFLDPPPNKDSSSAVDGFVRGVVTYTIMDDLVVKPMSSISSSISMLTKFNVKELGALEEKEVNLSMDEGLKLLKASFMTKTVLTNVFLGGKGK